MTHLGFLKPGSASLPCPLYRATWFIKIEGISKLKSAKKRYYIIHFLKKIRTTPNSSGIIPLWGSWYLLPIFARNATCNDKIDTSRYIFRESMIVIFWKYLQRQFLCTWNHKIARNATWNDKTQFLSHFSFHCFSDTSL